MKLGTICVLSRWETMPDTGSQSWRKFKGAIFCVVWGKVPQSSYLVGRVASGCFAQFDHEVSDTLPSLAF